MLNEMHSCNHVVNIGSILSTEHYFIELKSNNKLSIKIRTNVENEKNKISVINHKNGKLVIARKNKSTKLYRARVVIKCATGNKYKCFLIDCGIFEDCSEFFELNDYLQTVPPVKIHCSSNLSTIYNADLLEIISLSFIDGIDNCVIDTINMQLIEVGSPCIINIKIMDLKISDIIKPYTVTISRTNNVIGINYFKALLVST